MRGAIARVVSGVRCRSRTCTRSTSRKRSSPLRKTAAGTKMVEQYPARSLPSGSPLVECAGRKGGGRWHHAEHGKPAKVAASNLTCGRSRTHKGA